MEKLKIEYINTEELKRYENNAKVHTEEQIEQIKKSIEEFGMNDPIAVWKDNVIIEGHGRLIACEELGIKEVPVIRLDNLTDEQRKAYMLAHNKLTMNTDFDIDILARELDEIVNYDMKDFGFDIDDLDDIVEEFEEDEEVNKRVDGDIKFAEYIDEVSQYVVLKVRNEQDWKYISEVLELEKVKTWSTRKDGKENGVSRLGLGRVIDGIEAVNKIIKNYEDMEK